MLEKNSSDRKNLGVRLKKVVRNSALVIFALIIILVGVYLYRTHKAIVRVEKYRPQVEAQLGKYGLEKNTQLALAIIYTETKGGERDVMQSSESLNGNGQTNGISNEQESINQGIANLVEILEYANKKGCDVWTGVQAYNYGKSYVDYVAAHGGKNTLDLSRDYSRDVVAPSLGNMTSKTYTHLTWDSLFYNGGRLYRDGGNLFYAKEVHFNFDLLKMLK